MERRMTTRQEEQNKISHSFHKTSQRMRLNPRQSMKWKKRQRNPRAQQQNIIMRTSWEAKVNRGDHTESITWSITIVILFFDILRKQASKTDTQGLSLRCHSVDSFVPWQAMLDDMSWDLLFSCLVTLDRRQRWKRQQIHFIWETTLSPQIISRRELFAMIMNENKRCIVYLARDYTA